jgi:hypothetical protein
MKVVKFALPLVLLVALAVPITASAEGLADGLEDGRVVIGGTYTLESGQVLSGDLVVIGGSATTLADSRVAGGVALIGGALDIDGEVGEDVFALGGIVTLGPQALIHGDLVTIGAVVNRSEGARVEGQVTEGAFDEGFNFAVPGVVVPDTGRGIVVPEFGRAIDVRPLSWGLAALNPFFTIGWAVLRSLLMAGLAILVVMFWPERTARVARTVITQPVMAGGLGLLTAFFGVLLIVVLAITICLSPVSLIGGVVLGAALIFGWVAIGLEVGRRLAIAFKRDWQLATQAGLGTLLLSFVVYAVGIIPCIGFVFGVVLWAAGLGAVILTRFGGQESPAALPPAEIQSV